MRFRSGRWWENLQRSPTLDGFDGVAWRHERGMAKEGKKKKEGRAADGAESYNGPRDS